MTDDGARSGLDDGPVNPILNGPYDVPTRYYEMGPNGRTNHVLEGRRPSASFVPIAASRKGTKLAGGGVQTALDFDPTGERRETNELVNLIRQDVATWRHRDYERATPVSRKLLRHWADPLRENRVLFAQREAAETAIFLAEVSGRHGYRDWRPSLDDANAEHNGGLPRVALKMATGSGKTVVMAMLIAWQTINKVINPRDPRFAKRFLVIAPGVTIRDRLQVLRPGAEDNYYDLRDLVPPDLRPALGQAQIAITNYHSFLKREAKEVKGVAANTKKLLRAGQDTDPFVESDDAMVARVLRDLGGRGKPGSRAEQVVVFNDEAHHCYRDRPIEATDKVGSAAAKELKQDLETARVWFKGLQAVHAKVGIKTVFDLSATPYFLAGSGYSEGYLFRWVVSDFSLMDAIESGIVKIPRTPVDDDSTSDQVTYLHLWPHVEKELPKRKAPANVLAGPWDPPEVLQGALESLYRSYERSFEQWHTLMAPHGEPPPVFIVVCPNTVVSKLVHDWIAGYETPDGARVPGHLPKFANVADGAVQARPRTILVDSAQLESGEAMKADFKAVAAAEIEAFKKHWRLDHGGADSEPTDEELLREVLNTVGKKGKLGEDVRCVVSVQMLTEGWDANTVSHVLGVRAFGSQLLCEQVVGRGLRRRSYALDDDGRFAPEYANVYGIPFEFIPGDKPLADPVPRPPAQLVETVPGREQLRINFPLLEGYRVELPDEHLHFDPAHTDRYSVGPGTVPTTTTVTGVVGDEEQIRATDPAGVRTQQVAYALAARLLRGQFRTDAEDVRPWLFPRLVTIAAEWLRQCVDLAPGYAVGHVTAYAEAEAKAAGALYQAISRLADDRPERLRPLLRRFGPAGSTADVLFQTRKATIAADKSEISHVTLDGQGGNTWEQILALECERHPEVLAYAKNEHLGFAIPYVYAGRTHEYWPDFLVRLKPRDGDVVRTLVVEVSGGQKQKSSPGSTKEKADTARNLWCPAVNNHGGFGRWGYIEVTSMLDVRDRLRDAIAALYADGPLIGDPDVLDLPDLRLMSEVRRGA